MTYKSKKRFNTTKTKTKRMNKRKRNINQKGGLLNMSFGWGGKEIFGSTYGKKYYDNGIWKNQTCRKIFGFEYCTLDNDKEQV